LLEQLGYQPFQDWADGRSWKLGATYLVIEQSQGLSGRAHDRCRPGLNHLAFHVGDRRTVDEVTARQPGRGRAPIAQRGADSR